MARNRNYKYENISEDTTDTQEIEVSIESTTVQETEKLADEFKSNVRKNKEKHKQCKVLGYDKKTNVLDIMFDSYGIRLTNILLENVPDTIDVSYIGTIGKSDFSCTIK